MHWMKDSISNKNVMPNSGSAADNEDIWVELESDPGLFTMLIEDFGVRGVQVEEIYDLNSSSDYSSAYGFIFLFKWVEPRGRRARGASIANSTTGQTVTDESVVNGMFFAQQLVTNACATHALLSILLNSDDRHHHIELGPILTAFKNQTSGMTPTEKGTAVGNSRKIAEAHNKHARPDARRQVERDAPTNDTGRGKKKPVKRYQAKDDETFHFISYVPINGRLYELDGLKPNPVDHGEIPPNTRWTDHFQTVISARLGLANASQESNEIRYNLMALVPSKKDQYQRSLTVLRKNRAVLFDGLVKLLQTTDPNVVEMARQQLSSSASDFDNGSRRIAKKPRMDSKEAEDALMEAARRVEPSELFIPLTVVTSSGVEETASRGVSSGVNDQSAFDWPVTVEVVKLTKDGGGGVADQTRSPSSSSPLSSGFDSEHETSGDHRSQSAAGGGGIKREVKEEVSEMDDVAGPSNRSDESSSSGGKATVFLKLAVAGGGPSRFKLFDPLGLATYIQRLEEKIASVERQLAEEISRREQWEIDDQRRSNDYDNFTKTFLTLMFLEGHLKEPEAPTKNGKTKGRGGKGGAGTGGRKRKS